MPHHKSCKKRMRTSANARIRNRAYRTQMRSLIRQLREATSQESAADSLKKVGSFLDRMTRKGIIHKNRAASYKSRLSHRVKGLPAA